MPEHVHLPVSESKKVLLFKAIQALKLPESVQSLERPFWQTRYYDFNVHNKEKCIERLRYLHRNPVKRGLAVIQLSALCDRHKRDHRERILLNRRAP